MNAKSSITTMYEHSEVKVRLYEMYLSRYLNILGRTFVNRVYLYDLFCGEGIYENGGKGSPVITLECIKSHYETNSISSNVCRNIDVVFNDSEMSEIEPGKLKIDRVKELTSSIVLPNNVRVFPTSFNYSELVKKVIVKASTLPNDARALVFIDPWGYKEIDPKDLKGLLECEKVEVLLFLPIHFMYRFANKALVDSNYKGGNAIRKFISELYEHTHKPYFSNEQHFIAELHKQFKNYLQLDYVDVFKIERGNNNWFALFFFTHNRKGYWKMLDAKWQIDSKGGKLFKQADNEGTMFNEYDHSGYKQTVLKHLQDNHNATNDDLLTLGLQNNFLPKHTKAILDDIKKTHAIEILSLDGKAALSYYLGDESRVVNIRLKHGAN